MSEKQRFEGTKSYIATEDLKVAVNAAVIDRAPLDAIAQRILLLQR